MSAFGGKADIAKQAPMSANDPKRTSASPRLLWSTQPDFTIITHDA